MKNSDILIRVEFVSTKHTTLKTLNTLADMIGHSLVEHLYNKFSRSSVQKRSYPRRCFGNDLIITFIYR